VQSTFRVAAPAKTRVSGDWSQAACSNHRQAGLQRDRGGGRRGLEGWAPTGSTGHVGDLLVEAGRPAEATEVYEAALSARPHNGWSLIGLVQSLRAQGRTAEAEEAQQRFERAWVRSEVWLPASRF
jgi:tetratricopeptide (TPR) repeat protein